jgi:hypothetical protein
VSCYHTRATAMRAATEQKNIRASGAGRRYIFFVSPNDQRDEALGARDEPSQSLQPDPYSEALHTIQQPVGICQVPDEVVLQAETLGRVTSGGESQAAADRLADTLPELPVFIPPLPVEPIESPRPSRRRERFLTFVAFAALVTSLSSLGVIGWGVYRWRSLLATPERIEEDEDEPSNKRTGLSPEVSATEPADGAPPSLEDVIEHTKTETRGAIEVIDVGASSASLTDVLAAQRLVGEAKKQKLMLVLVGRRCEPCNGFDDSLRHPLMQRALADVRVVRVDLDVFKEELRRLRLPTNLYPAFFMLGDDLRPIDAIHGGEWDDDVAENMAPVLGAFVRGELRERRHFDWSPTITSIPL